jgi:uncharacterized membrane protein YebE (DUF533 family)
VAAFSPFPYARAMGDVAIDKALKGMLARIFADGEVEPHERTELDAKLKSGALSHDVVRATMLDFLRTSFSHVKADGVVTGREQERLKTIVEELALPSDCIPDEIKRAIAE